jgi:hypothetical protein
MIFFSKKWAIKRRKKSFITLRHPVQALQKHHKRCKWLLKKNLHNAFSVDDILLSKKRHFIVGDVKSLLPTTGRSISAKSETFLLLLKMYFFGGKVWFQWEKFDFNVKKDWFKFFFQCPGPTKKPMDKFLLLSTCPLALVLMKFYFHRNSILFSSVLSHQKISAKK